MKAESVIIDRTRVVGEFVFVTHGDRALYIGTSLNDTADPLDA